MNTQDQDCGQNNDNFELNVADRWIISRLQDIETQVGKAIEEYRLDRAAQALYGFIWDEYCSWYLELSKIVLLDDDASPAMRVGTRRTLVRVLEATLRLLHPLMPFITEQIWQQVASLAGKQGATIMTQPYPQSETGKIDNDALAEVSWLQAVVTIVRNVRGERNIEPGKALSLLLQECSEQDLQRLERNRSYLTALARLSSIEVLDAEATAPQSVSSLVGRMKVILPLASMIDPQAELERLAKEKQKKQTDIERTTKKLDNPDFVSRAPEEVVSKERDRLTGWQADLQEIEEQISKISELIAD